MKKQVLALVVLTAVGLWLSVGSASAADPIKIGVIYPLTGPNAAAGTYMRAGVEMARDRFNAEGGIIGRQVQLLHRGRGQRSGPIGQRG